jgi:outer membrane protein assembly factor BamE (lipoprotein component of BamABCDE complex)
MKKISALVLLCSSLAACATVGRQFDTTHVHDVRGGQAKPQITSWFGEPNQRTTFSGNDKGCVERWQYTYAKGSAGGSAHAQVLLVDFNAQGLVCDTAYSEVTQ